MSDLDKVLEELKNYKPTDKDLNPQSPYQKAYYNYSDGENFNVKGAAHVIDTKTCRFCGMQIPKSGRICPFCRKRQGWRASVVVGCVLLLFIICGNICSKPEIIQRDISPPIEAPYSTNDMTIHAVMIGRAIGCGIDTKPAMTRIGKWFDVRYEGSPKEKTAELIVFMQGTKYHAELQAKGKNPEDCESIRKTYNTWPWP